MKYIITLLILFALYMFFFKRRVPNTKNIDEVYECFSCNTFFSIKDLNKIDDDFYCKECYNRKFKS